MAYEVYYWKSEGKSDYELRHTRIARLEDIERDKLIESRPRETDVITLERTDKANPYYRELWKSDSYIPVDIR